MWRSTHPIHGGTLASNSPRATYRGFSMRLSRRLTAGFIGVGLLASLTGCDPETPSQYPTELGSPLDPSSDPPYTVPAASLVAGTSFSPHCTLQNAASTWEPILLVATGFLDATTWRSSQSARFADAGWVCVITIPDIADALDFTRGAQYVARAVTVIYGATGKKVDIIAHERGGVDARWAIRWWPSIRTAIDDVVLIGVPNRGSVDNMYLTAADSVLPIYQQSRADSLFFKALSSFDPTPGAGISYTNIASRDDRNSIGDKIRDNRETSWAIDGSINLLVQNYCAQTVSRHLVRDYSWVWAATRDALTGSGPASTARFNAGAPCTSDGSQSDPPRPQTDYQSAITPDSEPPLPDYVPMTPEETPPWASLNLPADQPDEADLALTEPLADRTAAFQCGSGAQRRYAAEPVLLVAGFIGDGLSMFTLMQSRFSSTANTATPYPVCWVQLPQNGAHFDLARGAQYVVHSIRALKALNPTGPAVDVLGHSRGGYDTAWALKWWADLRDTVDDVVLLDSPLRGTRSSMYFACPGCQPLNYQSRADSKFLAALRINDPTPGMSTSWTTIGTWDSPVPPEGESVPGSGSVFRDALDQRQYAWRWPGASNIIIQQYCPGRRVVHGPSIPANPSRPNMLTDDWAWQAIQNALFTPGPADPVEFVPTTSCGTASYTSHPRQTPPSGALPPVVQNDEPNILDYPYVWSGA